LNDYINAAREYSANHCMRNISFIQDYDLRSKGINEGRVDDGALLKELLFKILN
jgi:DNA polymerase-3 subunit delta